MESCIGWDPVSDQNHALKNCSLKIIMHFLSAMFCIDHCHAGMNALTVDLDTHSQKLRVSFVPSPKEGREIGIYFVWYQLHTEKVCYVLK